MLITPNRPYLPRPRRRDLTLAQQLQRDQRRELLHDMWPWVAIAAGAVVVHVTFFVLMAWE